MNDLPEDAAIRAAADAIGLALPEPCVPGVIQNRHLLDSHEAVLDRFLAEQPTA